MMTTNENLQQAYIMLMNSKEHLNKVKEDTFMKNNELNVCCEKITFLENKIYELIRFFETVNGDHEDDE